MRGLCFQALNCYLIRFARRFPCASDTSQHKRGRHAVSPRASSARGPTPAPDPAQRSLMQGLPSHCATNGRRKPQAAIGARASSSVGEVGNGSPRSARPCWATLYETHTPLGALRDHCTPCARARARSMRRSPSIGGSDFLMEQGFRPPPCQPHAFIALPGTGRAPGLRGILECKCGGVDEMNVRAHSRRRSRRLLGAREFQGRPIRFSRFGNMRHCRVNDQGLTRLRLAIHVIGVGVIQFSFREDR